LTCDQNQLFLDAHLDQNENLLHLQRTNVHTRLNSTLLLFTIRGGFVPRQLLQDLAVMRFNSVSQHFYGQDLVASMNLTNN
jgi:hypothetical protein